MTTLTGPMPSKPQLSDADEPIQLFQLGVLFVVRASYWTCKAGNEPTELNLSPDQIDARAIASFGTKDLIAPEKGRRVFQTIEKRARHELEKHSRPFPAAGAHFVPWAHAPQLVEKLEALRTEFEQAVEQFVSDYSQLRSEWRVAHPEIPDAVYPPVWELRRKFSLGWHAFKVSGASEALAIEDFEAEFAERQLRDEQLKQMRTGLQAEYQQFVADYVTSFRQEVAAFCQQVIGAGGQVHGKTLQAIRRKVDQFHAMNIFDDGEAAQQLQELKARISGLTGVDLAQQPALAEQLSAACVTIRAAMLDSTSVSALTGRLKRRVVLD